MLKRLKHLHKMWTLTKKDERFIEFLDKITEEDIKSIPDEETKATFIDFGTEEEYDKFKREEIDGWKAVMSRIFKQ